MRKNGVAIELGFAVGVLVGGWEKQIMKPP
jgi:hypothetical protein